MLAPDPHTELAEAIALADEHAEEDARRIYKAARRAGLDQEAAMARTLSEVGRVADRLAASRGYEPTFYVDYDDEADRLTAPDITDRTYRPATDGYDETDWPLWWWLVKRFCEPRVSAENVEALGYDPNDPAWIQEEFWLRLDEQRERYDGWRGPLFAPAKRRA